MRLSYSALATYGKCARKFKHRYVDRLPIPRSTSPAAQRGLDMHKTVEDFFLGKHEGNLPEPLDFYQEFFEGLMSYKCFPEWKFGLTEDFEEADFDAPNVRLRGVVDLKVVSDTLDLYEFKTGKFYADHASQMNLYGMAALLRYPEFEEATVTAIYFDKGRTHKIVYPRNMLDTYIYLWRTRMEEIMKDEIFMPQPSYACRWCEFSRANGGPCQF